MITYTFIIVSRTICSMPRDTVIRRPPRSAPRPPLITDPNPTLSHPPPRERRARRHSRPPPITDGQLVLAGPSLPPTAVGRPSSSSPRRPRTCSPPRKRQKIKPPAPPARTSSVDAIHHAYRQATTRLGLRDLSWTHARHPTLSCLEPLRPLVHPSLHAAVLTAPVDSTLLELQDCTGIPAHLIPDARYELSAFEDATNFDNLIAPSAHARQTRLSYGALWRSFVTYTLVRNSLHLVIPASAELVKGYLWTLFLCGLRHGSILLHLYAIIDRHRRFQYALPASQREMANWLEAFARISSVPKQDKLPLRAEHLRAILSMPRTSATSVRNILIVALGTICALRPSEITELDVCDVLFNFDAPDVMALCIKRRKNDQRRGGLWPRIGRPQNPLFDVQSLMLRWMQLADLHIANTCSKRRHPRSACQDCGRLFSRLQGKTGQPYPPGHKLHGITKNTVKDALHFCVNAIGLTTTGFSSVSMRRGGLTTAFEGGVPSDLYELQSGHRSDAWKGYVRAGKVPQLLRFYQSFQL